jgi:hypothetical protein
MIRRGVLVKWSLRRRIGHFLKRTRMTATAFGMAAARDPQLVFELRRGRAVRPPMEAKIVAFLDRAEREWEASNPPRRRRRR